jgi:small subunit ribosomal protein S3
MGQSINTNGLLLSYNKNWQSKWYNDFNYIHLLHEDILIRNYIKEIFRNLKLYFSKCIIKRSIDKIYIYVNIYYKNKLNKKQVINKKQIKQILSSLTKLTNNKVVLVIKPTNIFDAQLLAQYITRKLEMRGSFLNIFKKVLNKINRLNKANNTDIYKGLRIQCSGRPNGNDMAYIQWFRYGELPLHTYNYKIDYAYSPALTKYGISGIKVWISFV